MSNENEILSCERAFMAIPFAKVKSPNIPVDKYLQEAANLYHWCQPDKPQLLGAGLSEKFIDTLPVRADACRKAESLWIKARNTTGTTARQWAQRSVKGYRLRNQLLHTFRYAFRKNKQLLANVADIASGTGDPDLIQDLNDLAVLGRHNSPLLEQINLDNRLLTQAAILSDEMAGLLAAAKSEKIRKTEIRIIRNRAYTYLKEAVDEVKNCGKFVFWENPGRLRGYASAYRRKYG